MLKNAIKYFKKKECIKAMKSRGIRIAHHATYNNVEFGDYVNIAHHAEVSDCQIGKRTSVGRYTKIRNAKIGAYCSISWNVTIGAMGHPLNSVSSHAFSFRKQFGLCDRDEFLHHENVIIGNDVWIGCNVVIMPGIVIGDGAVLGGGAIITRNVKPYEIVAGCPAKHIRNRFPDDIIAKLIKIKWWEWEDNIIKDNIGLFSPHINIIEMPEILNQLEILSNYRKTEK